MIELEGFGIEILTREEEYINSKKSKLKFKCGCGEIYSKYIFGLRQSPKCKKCGGEESSRKQRLSRDELVAVYENNYTKLLSDYSEYINKYSKLSFTCSCGEIDTEKLGITALMVNCSKCDGIGSLTTHVRKVKKKRSNVEVF